MPFISIFHHSHAITYVRISAQVFDTSHEGPYSMRVDIAFLSQCKLTASMIFPFENPYEHLISLDKMMSLRVYNYAYVFLLMNVVDLIQCDYDLNVHQIQVLLRRHEMHQKFWN